MSVEEDEDVTDSVVVVDEDVEEDVAPVVVVDTVVDVTEAGVVVGLMTVTFI